MDAGRMRERVTIQRPVRGRSVSGAATIERWELVVRCWAEVRSLSARERWLADKLEAETTHLVTIRWVEGISPKHAVFWGGRRLEIQGVKEDTHRRTIEMTCVELEAPEAG